MKFIVEKIFHSGDERTRDWILVDTPKTVAVLIAAYILVVWRGPKSMEDRKPFKLATMMGCYNFGMTVLNGYIFYKMITAAQRRGYSWFCEPCYQIDHPDEVQVAKAFWWYFFSKLIEFCDTFFIILRKKRDQLTFLHVYHHSSMFALCWLSVKWVPTGGSFFPVVINSFVHIVMYSYYGLSMMGPRVERFLWWKKYLTTLQLVQFIIALLWSTGQLANGCEFPAWCNYISVFYMTIFVFLFGRFYCEKYRKTKTV